MNNNNFVIVNSVTEATIVVHSDTFHGDDAMAAAMAFHCFGPQRILRTRDQYLINEAAANGAIVCDVGGEYNPADNRFDHHIRGFVERREGDDFNYSSAGLFWKRYGAEICDKSFCLAGREVEAAEIVDRILVRGIDAGDAGIELPGGAWSIYSLLGASNLTYREKSIPDPYMRNAEMTEDDLFIEACTVAEHILWRALEYACSIVYGRKVVEDAVAAAVAIESKIVELPCYIEEWRETIIRSGADVLYGIFQDQSDEWRLQAIPESLDNLNGQRKPLPETWCGKNVTDLRDVTGVTDMVFCHPSGFICGAKSHKGIMQLARLAVES